MATVDDLRAVLAAHAADAPERPGLLGAVHDRVRRDTRRRRALAGAAVALVAVVAGGVALLPGRGPTDATVAAPRGVEAYYGGGALLASTTVSPAHPAASFSFTPTSWELSLRSTCAEAAAQVYVAVSIAGRPVGSGTCGGGWAGNNLDPATFWRGFGVALGRPVTVDVSLSAPVGSPPGTTVPPGVARVAAYQRVPLSDYPLPARPAALAPLETVPAGVGWDARRVGGGSGTTRTVQITQDRELDVRTVAPGAVRVTVDGTLVGLVESWDWSLNSTTLGLNVATLRAAGVQIDDGEGIDVTVTAERFSVPGWTAAVR